MLTGPSPNKFTRLSCNSKQRMAAAVGSQITINSHRRLCTPNKGTMKEAMGIRPNLVNFFTRQSCILVDTHLLVLRHNIYAFSSINNISYTINKPLIHNTAVSNTLTPRSFPFLNLPHHPPQLFPTIPKGSSNTSFSLLLPLIAFNINLVTQRHARQPVIDHCLPVEESRCTPPTGRRNRRHASRPIER